MASRYDNPIPSRFLAPIDCLQIPALDYQQLDFDSHSLQLITANLPSQLGLKRKNTETKKGKM
jgi:hypothetical protein